MESNSNKRFSFEFSAPKSEDAIVKLKQVHQKLEALGPDFYSVTYGAGGSTRDGTRQTVLDLTEAGSDVAPHLSFGGDSPDKIAQLLSDYKDAGVTRVVALRGDIPSGMGRASQIAYADHLVGFIREHTGDHFHIEVAAYPEVHPESVSAESDLKYFKQKIDSGADSAITQYFYNPDAYFHFVEACTALGIDKPVVPGIMPITNYRGLVRFSTLCCAEIPRWILRRLEDYEDDPMSLKSFGEDVVTSLCDKLLAGGAPGLHFYTLNQSRPTIRLWRNLGL